MTACHTTCQSTCSARRVTLPQPVERKLANATLHPIYCMQQQRSGVGKQLWAQTCTCSSAALLGRRCDHSRSCRGIAALSLPPGSINVQHAHGFGGNDCAAHGAEHAGAVPAGHICAQPHLPTAGAARMRTLQCCVLNTGPKLDGQDVWAFVRKVRAPGSYALTVTLPWSLTPVESIWSLFLGLCSLC